MSILPSGLAYLEPIVQDNMLVREFRDALFPQILFRGEAYPEKWEAQVGETAVITRRGLLDPIVTPLTPGVDPTPRQPSFEQWSVSCNQYGDAQDVHMPSSRTALASLYANAVHQMGLVAGQSLNRITRNKLFQAYLGGDTVAQAAGVAATALTVASINGFTTTVVNGAVVPVSPSAPKTVTISGVGTRLVTAATPTSGDNGPGTLTLSVAASWAANARVLAEDAPYIVRAGGATTVDGINPSSKMTAADIRKAVARMRQNRVPVHSDGLYHMHLDPETESDLFGDNEIQRLMTGVPENAMFRDLALGVVQGCLLISNNESPGVLNSGTLADSRSGDTDAEYSPEFYAEMRNSEGVAIQRSIMTGGGAIREKYVDEMEFGSDAGYTGKVGSWAVTNNGIAIPVERIRMIVRAPLDRMQQLVSLAWSFSGDWGIPTDLLGGMTGSRYKRAIVIESGSEQ